MNTASTPHASRLTHHKLDGETAGTNKAKTAKTTKTNKTDKKHKTKKKLHHQEQKMWDRARIIMEALDSQALPEDSATAREQREASTHSHKSGKPSLDTTATDHNKGHALFAAWLKELINDAKLTVEEISQKTKIPFNYVQALYEGNISKMPYEAMARGCILSITRLITPYPEPILTTYRACYAPKNTALTPPKPLKQLTKFSMRERFLIFPLLAKKHARKITWFALIAASAASMMYYAKLANNTTPLTNSLNPQPDVPNLPDLAIHPENSGNTNTTIQTATIPPEPSSSAAPIETTTSSPNTLPLSTTQTLRIQVLQRVEIIQTLDGVKETRTLSPGEYTLTFQDKALLTPKNLSALKLWYNDREVGELGKAHELKTFSFIRDKDSSQ